VKQNKCSVLGLPFGRGGGFSPLSSLHTPLNKDRKKLPARNMEGLTTSLHWKFVRLFLLHPRIILYLTHAVDIGKCLRHENEPDSWTYNIIQRHSIWHFSHWL